jgi:hypothetical protein
VRRRGRTSGHRRERHAEARHPPRTRAPRRCREGVGNGLPRRSRRRRRQLGRRESHARSAQARVPQARGRPPQPATLARCRRRQAPTRRPPAPRARRRRPARADSAPARPPPHRHGPLQRRLRHDASCRSPAPPRPRLPGARREERWRRAAQRSRGLCRSGAPLRTRQAPAGFECRPGPRRLDLAQSSQLQGARDLGRAPRPPDQPRSSPAPAPARAISRHAPGSAHP